MASLLVGGVAAGGIAMAAGAGRSGALSNPIFSGGLALLFIGALTAYVISLIHYIHCSHGLISMSFLYGIWVYGYVCMSMNGRYLRGVITSLLQFIVRQFAVTVTVSKSEPAYRWIIGWLAKNKEHVSASITNVTTSKKHKKNGNNGSAEAIFSRKPTLYFVPVCYITNPFSFLSCFLLQESHYGCAWKQY
jgi:hypothetical protein